MRLVGIGTVKNEADIIESFVRHNLDRLDLLILIDDGSVDGTRDVLRSLEAEGLNLLTLHWDGVVGQEQSRKLSELLLVLLSRINCHWIFPLDADEAIACESRATLEEAFQKIPRGRVGLVPWQTYIPTATDNWTESNPFRRIVNRKAAESPGFYKIVVPANLVNLIPIVVAAGNHTAHRATSADKLPMTIVDNVTLAHFPVRTPKQLVTKVVCGWLSLCAEGAGRPSRGFHWREMYRQFISDGAPTTQDIERLARAYSGQKDDGIMVCSPLLTDDSPPLRYGQLYESPMFVGIARTAEHIIGSVKGTWNCFECNELVNLRVSWRHRPLLLRHNQTDQENAARRYLKGHFGSEVQFVDDRKAYLLPKLFNRKEGSTMSNPSVILLSGAANYRQVCGSMFWRENGWVVDPAATLAVRLLARSTDLCRYAVVFVLRSREYDSKPLSTEVPAPAESAWWECARLAILRCHFWAIKCFWRIHSAIYSAERMVLSNDNVIVRPAASIHIAKRS